MNRIDYRLFLALCVAAPLALAGCGDDDGSDDDGAGSGSSGSSGSSGAGSGSSGSSGGSGAGPDDECDLSGEGKETETLSDPTGSITLTSDKVWILDGIVHVADGQTLTIEPCTRIEGEPGSPPGTLVVSRGGKIMAEGEADAPILFTSALSEGEREAGQWGGVILLGDAPNFRGDAVLIEGLADEEENYHGGDDADDDSGVMTYVRIEYGGYELMAGNEINGLTMGSVGSGTEIHHIMVNTTLDDCFEWFGGTVDAHHLICSNAGDDMFDADQGYAGSIEFLFGRMSEVSSSDPSGFEMDSDPDSTDAPVTNVTASNVTLCGAGEALSATARGLVLRENLTGEFDNIVVTGFDNGVDIRDDFGSPADPNVTLANSIFFVQQMNDIAADETGDDDNDSGFSEVDWFEMGVNNTSDPDPVPFTVMDCLAADGPTDDVTGSEVGAFADDNWLEGMWIDWATE